MSEKRFKKMDTIIDPFPIWDTVEEKGYNCTDTLDLLVDLLNNLHQENQQSKHYKLYEDNKRLQTIIADLKEENEQLKRLINSCEYGQKNLMEEMKNNDEALDKIWEIMKELYGVIDDE